MNQAKIMVRMEALTPKLRTDVLLVPITVEGNKFDVPKIHGLAANAQARVAELAKRSLSLGAAGSIDGHILPDGATIGRLALESLGDKPSERIDDVRTAGAAAFEWCTKHRVNRAAVCAESLRQTGDADAVAAWIEGFLLASFRFTMLRSNLNDRDKPTLRQLTLATQGRASKRLRDAVARAQKTAEAVNLARHLGHEPPNLINPVTLASRCRSLSKRCKLRCRVLDDKRLKALKMGAFLAVGAGSATKPRMIILEHTGGRPKSKPIVLVGKAITLDTGGYSIKPANTIPDMKYDKCGGMAVIGALVAAAQLKISRRIVGVIGAAENMISDRAYRPGDIVRASNGKTIEVLNTDAEGRLVLADCLHYAEKTFKPAAIIDLATLTGACLVALGTACAGLMSNNDELAQALIDGGERTGERLWRLPLWPVYREQIAGTDADIKNVGGRNAGTITAGIFLKEFVSDNTPWAHLDIAGPATTEKSTPICPVGATGFGVRLLLDYFQNSNKI